MTKDTLRSLFDYCVDEIEACDEEMYQANLSPCKFIEFTSRKVTLQEIRELIDSQLTKGEETKND